MTAITTSGTMTGATMIGADMSENIAAGMTASGDMPDPLRAENANPDTQCRMASANLTRVDRLTNQI
jgi:hypothetical protein